MSMPVQAAELAAKDAEDPLDAFMAQEILPEVKQKEKQEAARKEEERKALAQQLAVGLSLFGSQDATALPSGLKSAFSCRSKQLWWYSLVAAQAEGWQPSSHSGE